MANDVAARCVVEEGLTNGTAGRAFDLQRIGVHGQNHDLPLAVATDIDARVNAHSKTPALGEKRESSSVLLT